MTVWIKWIRPRGSPPRPSVQAWYTPSAGPRNSMSLHSFAICRHVLPAWHHFKQSQSRCIHRCRPTPIGGSFVDDECLEIRGFQQSNSMIRLYEIHLYHDLFVICYSFVSLLISCFIQFPVKSKIVLDLSIWRASFCQVPVSPLVLHTPRAPQAALRTEDLQIHRLDQTWALIMKYDC